MTAKKGRADIDAQTDLFRRLNIKVTEPAYERLLLHSMKRKQDPGKVVTGLIDETGLEMDISDVKPKRLALSQAAIGNGCD